MPTIPLAEMIQTLRHELSESMKAAASESLRFGVETVQLELQVTMSREGSAGGKVKFWVVDVEAGGKLSRSDVHTFRLTLKPVSATGGPVAVNDTGSQRPGG